ncbi:MAG: alpha-galactosidase [Victivallaceae bacterium]|nr:alpha-galactosidase [Victivallaceae bacterium]
MISIVRKQQFGDMLAVWAKEDETVELRLVPAGREGEIAEFRDNLNKSVACRVLNRIWDMNFPARRAESAIQYRLAGDKNEGMWTTGSSMRNSGSVEKLGNAAFEEIADGVRLVMKGEHGIVARQTVRHVEGEKFFRIVTSLENTGSEPVDVEYLASFSLGGLSPFQPDDGPEAYEVCRWHSNWSAEGRLEQLPLEMHGLERSWAGFSHRVLRFGQPGTAPVQNYFPQVGFIDRKAGAIWGASLANMGSWQLEVSRILDNINLSGGLADRDLGHWSKRLAPGETLTSPEAAVTCGSGDVDDICNRLREFGQGEVRKPDEDCPVMVNEWCTTWGKPYPDRLLPISERLKKYGPRYFVLDDGWFRKDSGYGIGDWVVAAEHYPEGLKAFVAELRRRGYIPGIWFEFENAVDTSTLLKEHPDWFLHRDGKIIRTGIRSFLDFRKQEVIDYLAEKVIAFLKENGFGYMKVDYNSPVGFGCDGCESPGEGLRQHMIGVEKFFRRILDEIPDFIIEACASGGYRIAPGWLRMVTLVSSSDAHEGVEIPLVAANTARLIPMRKNQIWATLHGSDDDDRLHYSLAATFMGRLCLSGDIEELQPWQEDVVAEACDFFRALSPLIISGNNRLDRRTGLAYSEPHGSQTFIRENADMKLVVVHTFHDAPKSLKAAVGRKWKVERVFAPKGVNTSCCGLCGVLKFSGLHDFQGAAVLLRRK